MMEQIKDCIIPTIGFFLLFFLVFLMVERYKKSIRAFFAKHSRLATKIPRDKVIKIGIAWVGILLLRKLIYYVSPHGVIQTKFSLWWVDNPVLIIIYCVPIGILFALPLLRLIRRIEKSSEARSNVIKIIIFIILQKRGRCVGMLECFSKIQ